MRIIDLLSFTPFFLGIFAAGDFLKILRLLRVFRVLRILKKIPLTNEFIKSLKDYKEEYRAVFILFLVILFVGSFFVYFAERYEFDTKFTNIPITIWWGIVTMSTV
jgi:voltage-gated potassium channel